MKRKPGYAVVHITRGHFYCTRHKGEVGAFQAYYDPRTNELLCKECAKRAREAGGDE